MPGLNKKFTDSNLKLYYVNLLNHYQDCTSRLHSDTNAIYKIYNEMYLATQYAVEAHDGSFYRLDSEEKNKVYQSFDAIFRALPLYRGLPSTQRNTFNPPKPDFNVHNRYVPNNYQRYDCYDSTLFNWLLLSSITNRSSSYSSYPSGSVHTHPGSHTKNNGDSSTNDNTVQIIVVLALLALAAFAAVLTFIALYYMFSEFLDSVERFWYNEGWLKAALMLASSVAFGAASTVLTVAFAAFPLAALAIAAGLNPLVVVVIATVCLTVIGAGIGCFVMSLLYDSIDNKLNEDSMDPSDPCRFRLTTSDEQVLRSKNLDPIKIKCAMVAMRAEISRILDSEDTIPSFLSRQFGDGQKVQALLQQVRELRNGTISSVVVGNLSFDCTLPLPPSYHYGQQHLYAPQQPEQHTTASHHRSPPSFNPDYEPSAPLHDDVMPPAYSPI